MRNQQSSTQCYFSGRDVVYGFGSCDDWNGEFGNRIDRVELGNERGAWWDGLGRRGEERGWGEEGKRYIERAEERSERADWERARQEEGEGEQRGARQVVLRDFCSLCEDRATNEKRLLLIPGTSGEEQEMGIQGRRESRRRKVNRGKVAWPGSEGRTSWAERTNSFYSLSSWLLPRPSFCCCLRSASSSWSLRRLPPPPLSSKPCSKSKLTLPLPPPSFPFLGLDRKPNRASYPH